MTELTQKILRVIDRLLIRLCGFFPKPLQRLIRRWHRLLTYAFMGCINTLVDYAAFSLLYYALGAPVFWGQAAGMLLGACVGFLLNSSATFAEGKGRSRGQFFQYVGFDSVMAVVSGWVMRWAETQLSMPVLLVKAVITVVVMLIHYMVYKTVVFRIKKEDNEK